MTIHEPISPPWQAPQTAALAKSMLPAGAAKACAAIELALAMTLLAYYGDQNTKAASGLILSVKGVFVGPAMGAVLSPGHFLAKALEAKNVKLSGDIIKTGYVFTAGVSLLTMITLNCFTLLLLPKLVNPSVAHEVAKYILPYSLNIFPECLIIVSARLFFLLAKNPQVALYASLAYRFSLLVLTGATVAYFQLGPIGAGFSSLIAWPIAALITSSIFKNPDYQSNYHLNTSKIEGLKTHLFDFSSFGAKIAVQRLLEWLSSLSFSVMIDRSQANGLLLTVPAIHLSNLCAVVSEGMGCNLMLITSAGKEAYDALVNLESKKPDNIANIQKEHASLFHRGCGLVSLVAAAFATVIYLFRQPYTDLILGKLNNHTEINTVNTALLLSAIKVVIDGYRISSMCALRSWELLWKTTFISATSIMGAGILAGQVFLALGKPGPESFTSGQAIGMVLAAAGNELLQTRLQHSLAILHQSAETLNEPVRVNVTDDTEETVSVPNSNPSP